MHVNAITVYRCDSCKKIVTDIEVKKLGGCPFCNGHRIVGTSPTNFEKVKLFFRLLFKKG